jgi:DNA-binding NarL/FixJ family response regulator
VLLVDDHPVVREGIRAMLTGEPGIAVVGEASSGEEALLKASELNPNVVLTDIRMPGMGGMETTRQIKKAHPRVSVIVLTMYDSEMYLVEAIRSGASGYVTKDCSRELLCQAVRAVVEGGALVDSRLLRQAIQGLLHTGKGMGDAVDSSLPSRLSPREQDVLRLLAQGNANKDICAELNLAEVTVKKHVQSLIGKLGVSDRTQAAILGVRLGVVQ